MLISYYFLEKVDLLKIVKKCFYKKNIEQISFKFIKNEFLSLFLTECNSIVIFLTNFKQPQFRWFICIFMVLL